MIRLIALSLLLALAARAEPARVCPSVERSEARPVYVVLFGYPHGQGADQKTLRMVDHDLLHMSRFFEALGPEAVWIHAEAEGSLFARFGTLGVRQATWRALLGTVDKLVEQMSRHEQRPQVYLYFSGHGSRTAARATLYARPEPGATEPGFNGRLDSKLIAENLLGPLSVNADVHLLADTCFSYFLLQTRRMTQISREKLDPPDVVFDGAFAGQFPGVGALLATRGYGVTYENWWHGGIFSHALRSVAFGSGDLNGDGVVTYGELDFALAWVSEGSPYFQRPAVVAPKLDPDRVFIDWRGSPAARVCASGEGRHFVLDAGSLFATVHLPDEATPLWLKQEHVFAMAADVDLTNQQTFVAKDGPLVLDADVQAPDIRGPAFAEFFPQAIDATGFDPSRPVTDGRLPFQLAAAATFGFSYTGDDDFLDGIAAGAPHLDLSGRVGYHRHRLLVEGSYTRWRLIEQGTDNAGADPVHGSTNAFGWRLGYGLMVYHGDLDVEVGVLGGMHWLYPTDWSTPFGVEEAAARVAVVFPWGPRDPWAWRIEGQVGVMHLDDWHWPTVRLSGGVDFEWLFR